MDSDKKLKSILVFDDPATSFDDNSIKSVICKIMQLSRAMDKHYLGQIRFMYIKKSFCNRTLLGCLYFIKNQKCLECEDIYRLF